MIIFVTDVVLQEEAKSSATMADDRIQYCRHIIPSSLLRFASGCSHVHHYSRTLPNRWCGLFQLRSSDWSGTP
jgi:hypothetical protein